MFALTADNLFTFSCQPWEYIKPIILNERRAGQPRTQALLPTPGAAAKTLASFGHVSLIKFSSRGGDGSPKVDLFAGYC